MKQLVILSGKGGTGKTSVAAAFAQLASSNSHAERVVLVDADVDAANLELLLTPQIHEKHAFDGGKVAVINQNACLGCGDCMQICRFDAIQPNGTAFQIDPLACDGCSACVYQCPGEAISMEGQMAGYWFRSDSLFGPLFHASLRPAQENSGKLVTMVKQQARLLALDENYSLVLVDGPPGIGCPVISAVSGADLALIVTEPTVAGVHDMRRILETTAHFGVPAVVCINKADLYKDGATDIETFCREHEIDVVGTIPFDPLVTEAMVLGQAVTAYCPEAPASKALNIIWSNVTARLAEIEK